MKNFNFYTQSKLCWSNGNAIRRDKSDIVLCVKHGGECKFMKCSNIHRDAKGGLS